MLAVLASASMPTARGGFALSDVALFAAAVLGIWLARRSMRARARRRSSTRP
jgi:hypothetical protein